MAKRHWTQALARAIEATGPLAARYARALFGEPTTTPVEWVPGNVAPHRVGERGYHTTLSGKTVVRHPGAYGYPTLYHHSTVRIVVGGLYAARHWRLDVRQRRMFSAPAWTWGTVVVNLAQRDRLVGGVAYVARGEGQHGWWVRLDSGRGAFMPVAPTVRSSADAVYVARHAEAHPEINRFSLLQRIPSGDGAGGDDAERRSLRAADLGVA